MGYNILSPDDITINYDNFPTKETAYAFFLKWKERFQKQGYYSSNWEQIPLNKLAENCILVEYNEDGTVFEECILEDYVNSL